MKNYEIVVFYHGNCIDGFAAAAVTYGALINTCHPVRYLPVNYGDVPSLKNDLGLDVPSTVYDIIFLDFCPPLDWVRENVVQGIALSVLDHHNDKAVVISEISTYLDSIDLAHELIFDETRSGVGLAWDRAYPEEALPLPLSLIQDRDLWLPNADRRYHEYFCLFLKKDLPDLIFPQFLKMVECNSKFMTAEVEVIVGTMNAQRDQHIEHALSRSVIIPTSLPMVDGAPAIVACYVSVPHYLISEFADRYLTNYQHVDLVVNITVQRKGTGFSFRSRKGTGYAQAVAKAFDGGGHPDAAGGRYNRAVSFSDLAELISTAMVAL